MKKGDTKKIVDKKYKLTLKQKKFANEYIENWNNATRAIKKVYDVKWDSTARSMWTENLTKPSIKAYLDDKWDKAWLVIEELMDDYESPKPIRLEAAKFIYDHAHWKATQKVQQTWLDWWPIIISWKE
jgi:phage terminase small subunit